MRILRLPYQNLNLNRSRPLHGSGIGGLFRGLSRFLVPALKTAVKISKPYAKRVGKHLLKSGTDVAMASLQDISDGKDPRQAIKDQVKQGLKRSASSMTQGLVKDIKRGKKKKKTISGGSSAQLLTKRKRKRKPAKKKTRVKRKKVYKNKKRKASKTTRRKKKVVKIFG